MVADWALGGRKCLEHQARVCELVPTICKTKGTGNLWLSQVTRAQTQQEPGSHLEDSRLWCIGWVYKNPGLPLFGFLMGPVQAISALLYQVEDFAFFFFCELINFLLTYFSILSDYCWATTQFVKHFTSTFPAVFWLQQENSLPQLQFYRRLFTHYSHCLLLEETPLLTAMTWQEINVCTNLHMYMCVCTHTLPS